MKRLSILGIIRATIPLASILTAISFSPWFSFHDNALSDLGNIARNGSVSYIFNGGLVLSGLLVSALAFLLSTAKHSSKFVGWMVPLVLAVIDLTLIGIFTEDLGAIHRIVSETFFIMMILVLFLYIYLSWPIGTPVVGLMTLVFAIASMVIWFSPALWQGVAIQELATLIMTSIWLVIVSIKNV
jgi:hypothetical membrane protein